MEKLKPKLLSEVKVFNTHGELSLGLIGHSHLHSHDEGSGDADNDKDVGNDFPPD